MEESPASTRQTKRPVEDQAVAARSVTLMAGSVVGLTFVFGFGNVLSLALRLGVPWFIAPLVAPAVDLSVVGLLLGTRCLVVRGADPEQLRPVHRLLVFASAVSLALNVAEPLIMGHFGRAAFDAVGPLLLMGWVEVGPDLLRSIAAVGDLGVAPDSARRPESQTAALCPVPPQPLALLDRAQLADREHRELHMRPISAETLRKQLSIGSARSRALVAEVRKGLRERSDDVPSAYGN